jgi:hypothetical protein
VSAGKPIIHKAGLGWFLEFVCKNSPEQDHKVLAYMALTRLKVLQSGRSEPKFRASLKLLLMAHVGMIIKEYGLIGKTPEQLLEEEGV